MNINSKILCSLPLFAWMICASIWMVYQSGHQVQVKSSLLRDCLSKTSERNGTFLQTTAMKQEQVELEYKKKLMYYESKLYKGGVDLKNEKCTLVMLTFKRVQTLGRVLKHYCRVTVLNKIILIWNDVGSPIPKNISRFLDTCNIQLLIINSTENRLTNRFIPRPELESDCICIIDDDRIVSNYDMEFGFEVWQNFRHRIVGFEERGYILNGTKYKYTNYNRLKNVVHGQKKRSSNSVIEVLNGTRILHIGNKTYILGKALKKQHKSNDTLIESADGYSIMLTSVCFVHRIYLEMFFDPSFVPSGVREEIDKRRNCEDIMLSILVTKFLQDISWPQCGVLAVKASFGITNLDVEANMLGGREGLSKRKDHYNERSNCLKMFAELYGYLPLVNSTTIVSRF